MTKGHARGGSTDNRAGRLVEHPKPDMERTTREATATRGRVLSPLLAARGEGGIATSHPPSISKPKENLPN